MAKRTFGSVDRLPSGRYRARYLGPDGRRHAKVFNSNADAWAWLASEQTDLPRKSWRAPNAVHRTVGEYAEDYFARNGPTMIFVPGTIVEDRRATREELLAHRDALLSLAATRAA